MKPLAPSTALANKVLHAAMTRMSTVEAGISRADLREWMGSHVDFNEWEDEIFINYNRSRWWTVLNFISTDAARSEWIVKDNGVWTITESGIEALDTYSPEELFPEARRRSKNVKSITPKGPTLRSLIMRSGLQLMADSDNGAISKNTLLERIPQLLKSEDQERLDTHSKRGPRRYCYGAMTRAVKAGLMKRNKGTWNITDQGRDALSLYEDPMELRAYATSLSNQVSDETDDTPDLGEPNLTYKKPASLYSSTSSTIRQVIEHINQGLWALPDIQRPFVWKNAKVRDLFDSLMQGFPIGYVLTWRSPADASTRQIGTDSGRSTMPYALVIDGQQRITSLYAVLTGKEIIDEDFQKRHIQIAFHPIECRFEVTDNAIRRSPEWIENISDVFTNDRGALAIVNEYINTLVTARAVDDEHRIAAENNIQRLVNLQQLNIHILEVDAHATEEEVAEIFVRINSKGQQLNQSDFILTLLSVFWEEGRNQLEQFARNCKILDDTNAANPYNLLLQPGPDELIRAVIAVSHRRARLSSAYQLLRGKDASTNSITESSRDFNLSKLATGQAKSLTVAHWHEFLKVLESIGYRRSHLIHSMNVAMMCYAFWLIGRTEFGLSVSQLRSLIGRWFMFLTLVGRYSGSAETYMEEDLAMLNRIKDGDSSAFISALESTMQAQLTDDFWTVTLPYNLKSSIIRTAYPFFASQALLNSNALFSDLDIRSLLNPERQSTRQHLEVHHLFPKNWLKANGYSERREYNQIANQTLVEWSVNAAISDRAPTDYGPEYTQRIAESTRKQILKDHALPERWWDMPYEDFLTERRILMAGVIKRSFDQIGSCDTN